MARTKDLYTRHIGLFGDGILMYMCGILHRIFCATSDRLPLSQNQVGVLLNN